MRDDGVFEPTRQANSRELYAQLRGDGAEGSARDVPEDRVEAPVIFIHSFEGKRVRRARERARRETQRVPPRRRAGDGTLAVAVLFFGAGTQALDGPRRGHGLGEIERELVPFPEPLRTPRALAEPKPREPSFYCLVSGGRVGGGRVGVGVGAILVA